MLNNQQFTDLERRLWKEGNPLCDELVSTRDALIHLIYTAKALMANYEPLLNEYYKDDLGTMQQWDNFGDTLDNLTYELGN
jgi:hypothetical protein